MCLCYETDLFQTIPNSFTWVLIRIYKDSRTPIKTQTKNGDFTFTKTQSKINDCKTNEKTKNTEYNKPNKRITAIPTTQTRPLNTYRTRWPQKSKPNKQTHTHAHEKAWKISPLIKQVAQPPPNCYPVEQVCAVGCRWAADRRQVGRGRVSSQCLVGVWWV